MVCYHETVDLFTSKGGVIPGGCGRFPVSVYFEEMGLFIIYGIRMACELWFSAFFVPEDKKDKFKEGKYG